MNSPRKTSSPFLAMMVAGVGVGGLIVWWTFVDPSAGRSDDRGGIAPADSSGGALTQAAATPPWASEEQKAKAAERAEQRRKKFELYAELTKGLPELQPKLEGIPEFEVNGFERLVALAKAREDDLSAVPEEFMEMLEGKRPWDGLAVGEYLKQHAELLNELAAISRLPAGEVDWRIDPAYNGVTSILTMGNILCLAALNDAHDRRPGCALDGMEVLGRISGHLISPENVTSLAYAVGKIVQTKLTLMLPLVAKHAPNDIGIQARLDELLEIQRIAPQDMAHYYRADTISAALISFIPTIQAETHNLNAGTELLRSKFALNVEELEAMRTASGFGDLKGRLEKLYSKEVFRRTLSAEVQTPFGSFWGKTQEQIGFFVCHETQRQIAMAAVRLVRDDSAPETILAEIAASEPEPRKLHYDPATRTLTSEPFLTETEKISIQVP